MLDYEPPVFRPPSEADNLIIQATVGCSYNQCTFCSMYTMKQYRARPLADVESDIADWAAVRPEAHRVFLADGDALTLDTEHLVAICDRLDATFPELQRVSAYATPANLLKKTPGELERLKAHKLSLVYLGVETGDRDLLKRIRKGATPEGMEKALNKAAAAGLKVSATVILGLGGRNRWQAHVDNTAALLSRAPVTYLSTLQLFLEPGAEKRFYERFGEPFAPQDDAGVLAEQERFLAAIDPPKPVIFRSNHASNALPLKGTLPKHRDQLLATLAQAREQGSGLRPAFLRGL